MSELLLEIGCEEIPARFLSPALLQLEEKAKKALEKSRISFGETKTYGTPRRMALSVTDLADMQEGYEDKRLGPAVKQAFDDSGAPTKAALGFARSCGVEVDELGREDTPKGEKLLYIKKVEGKPAAEVLSGLLPELIRSLDFPKSMRWGSGDLAFVRPIHWVVSILDGGPISFELDGIKSGNVTRGHRFTNPGEIRVEGVADYLDQLWKNGVAPNASFRKETIERDIERKSEEISAEIIPDPGLVDEVTNLVEFPVVISGKFDERYLELPPQVPVAAMRTHQRYFAVRKPGTEMELLPYFITVANTPAKDMDVVIRGNERVLGARLADAEFYWKEDLKKGIEKMREDTKGMVFYKTLGSYMDKTDRVEKLCSTISEELYPGASAVKEGSMTGARYCKADLVSEMVGEFPELQGLMGGEYAKAAGFKPYVCPAIRDHYLPRSAEDIAMGVFPETKAGDVLALADKLDSVVSMWAAGLAPTGAGDPFALRRQAQGMINLLLYKGYSVKVPSLVREAAALSCPVVKADEDKVIAGVVEFFLQRFRVQLIDSGHPYDVVDAGLAAWNGDLLDTLHKIEAVGRMKKRDDFDDLMVAFRRLLNIVEGTPGKVDPDLFQEESEAVLYGEYTRVLHNVVPLLEERDYDRALEEMAGLKTSVDRFFDDVMVNVEDEKIKGNRHALCHTVGMLFKEIADFSRIVVEGER